MKQIAQNYKTGEMSVRIAPTPAVRPGGVVVRNWRSLISAGTEKTKIDTARMSLMGKARSRPDQVKKVLQTLRKEGYLSTYRKVMGKLDSLSPLGYSSAGVVMQVGEGVSEFRVGDRVACAGAGYANHAEAVFVPQNLCVKLPDSVSFEQGCFATVGAIALQGVRQADCRLGERIAVIGLGLLGQLTVQLLKASGCLVLGIDVDAACVTRAKDSGADLTGVRGQDDVVGMAASLSKGRGLDAVIITAATKSNDPVELAPQLLRDRGRVVVVGAVSMQIPREPYFQKEIDVRLSRSYGPGRYDVQYEEKGHDYPYGYVRWTENRNMGEFVRLIAEGKVRLEGLITHSFKIDEASSAYELIAGKSKERYVGILLKYDGERELERIIPVATPRPSAIDSPGIGMIGAGSFAKSTILPRLRASKVHLRGLHTATGLTAADVADKFGFEFIASSSDDVIRNRDTQAVFITTRHNLHAILAMQALREGKAVFVEKPLAITPAQLDGLLDVWRETQGSLMVGFNRRFAPMSVEARRFFESQTTPLAIQIRVNAGAIPADHWIQDPEEGGGRILGEVCHFLDLAQFLAGSPIQRVSAEAVYDSRSKLVCEDTLIAQLRHENGSICSISYFANGDTSYPKERIEIYGGGALVVIDDFVKMTTVSGAKCQVKKAVNQDKGHAGEIALFIDALRNGTPMPITMHETLNTTLAAFAVKDAIRLGLPVEVRSS